MTLPASFSSSTLLEYLPALYREDAFAGQFLSAFEKILLGRDQEAGVDFPFAGLEKIIAEIATLFDPQETPEKFLGWLADWAAFSLRADLDVSKQRDFLASIIQLYRMRGTKANLQNLLKIFTVGVPAVTESTTNEFQIGVHSTIGLDTYINGGAAHYFRVTISLSRAAPEVQAHQGEIARELIEMEKPAYTYYDLDIVFPSMKIGQYSTVGVDTLLGTGEDT
jgi:phage tail-like protein